jgi:hypothetical protein
MHILQAGWIVAFLAYYFFAQYYWDNGRRVRAVIYWIISALILAVYVIRA